MRESQGKFVLSARLAAAADDDDDKVDLDKICVRTKF